MEELQTDTLYNYEKSQNVEGNCDSDKATDSLLNGCDEDDPLDLMDHCDNDSIGSNSDVWKGSDSEDEKDISNESKKLDETKNDSVLEVRDNEKSASSNKDIEEIEPEEPLKASENLKETELDLDQVIEQEQKQSEAQEQEQSEHIESEKEIIDLDAEEDPSPKEIHDLESQKDSDDLKLQKDLNLGPPDEAKELESEKESNDLEIRNDAVDLEIGKDPKDLETEKNAEGLEPQNEVIDLEPEKNGKGETSKEDLDANKATDANEDLSGEAISPEKDPLASTPPPREFSRNDPDADNDCQLDYDAEDFEDFDPSLFCPEVSMDVDENPVVTCSNSMPNDEMNADSPLPYETLFSTFVDDVTGAEILFNLTPEELEIKKRLYGLSNQIQTTKIHCTACNIHLGSALEGQSNRFVHPLLKVLICKECYHFYTSGEFEKDEDGSELYCRWCGQGGNVLCCSKCEFVFCKRCIRTNFGRKKMFEIRDSDSWECFRCNPSQIISQRVHCFAFFEYIRHEMAQSSALTNPLHWSKDYSKCCFPKKRPSEFEEAKKSKKRKDDVDPDYAPVVEENEKRDVNMALNKVNATLAKEGLTLPKPIRILPKPTLIRKDNDIEFVRQIKPPQTMINRPQFRASMLSSNIKTTMPPAVVRITAQPVPPLVPTHSRILNNALQIKTNNEWFEKTVKAAARVNSNLSFTLTQLFKAQNQAASVEELAVVHNKLQEILSSSINSLIQIRKNLRTEFINGIKKVKLPAKTPVYDCNNDDDVICVSSPAIVLPMAAQDPLAIRPDEKRSFLKVKSVKDLQNVPSECITIPDDTPPPPPLPPPPQENNVPEAGTSRGFEEAEIRNGLSDSVSLEKIKKVPNDKMLKVKSEGVIFTVKNVTAKDVKKMMTVRVKLARDDLEELQKEFHKKIQEKSCI